MKKLALVGVACYGWLAKQARFCRGELEMNKVLLFLVLVVSPSVALSAISTWTVSGTTQFGNTLSGSFDFDDVLNTYSNVSVTRTFTSQGPVVYTDVVGPYSSDGALRLSRPTANPSFAFALQFDFSVPLVNSLTSASFTGREGTCSLPSCASVSTSVTTSGTVTNTSVVPLPAAAWLFGSALLGLGITARRKLA